MHADHDRSDHDHNNHDRGPHESGRADHRRAMSAGRAHADPDVLTAMAVHHQVFSVVRLREGYDLAEVDAFLTRVETSLAQLWDDNTHLREQLAVRPTAEPAPSPTEAEARREADELLAAAEQQAHQILHQARARAQIIHDEAQQSARGLLEQAHTPYRHLVDYHLGQLSSLATDHGHYLHDGLAAHLAQLRRLLAAPVTPDPLTPARPSAPTDQFPGPQPGPAFHPSAYRPGHPSAGMSVSGSLVPAQPPPETNHRA
ncbi:DivIVA domain-containing protein [Nonomuraea sp. NPDC049152]|uniref:DivIVA domain-containing protein n=1 Tax=Nonomuraea sp. NPDC049152 TaxID=3154350 RepID=UPI00341099CE